MKIDLEPGRYVLAVSGGIDSCVLLHLLKTANKYDLIVAHYNHGIRPDSNEDESFVASLADKYGLQFVSEKGELGEGASEAAARAARYAFLYSIAGQMNAEAIVTAHHQDDLLETAVMNMLRGSGRKGLTSLRDLHSIRRPLLTVSKEDLKKYAESQNLEWREDSTNTDIKYFRNYIRLRLLPKFTEANKMQLLKIIENQTVLNDKIDELIADLLSTQPDNSIERIWFNSLPHPIAKEVIAAWLRENGIRDFDRRAIDRLVIAGKVTRPDKQIDILHNVRILVEKDRLALAGLER